MALMSASALPVAQLQAPTIDVAGQFQQGKLDAATNTANDQTNQAQMVEMLAHGAAAALPQGPAGPVDADTWNQFLDSMEQGGMPKDKIAAFRGNPEIARILLKGSATALKNQYDAATFDRSLKVMDEQIKAAVLQNSRTPAPAIEAQYDPTTGTDQKMQWNATDAVWEPFGGPKSATATDKNSPETWFGNIVYFRDPKTRKIVAGQASSWGRFKPMEGADGLEPAVPVQQLNTETGFQPVTKFGDVPPDAPVTPIDNAGAAKDTAIGKGEGEKIVAMPALKSKAISSLEALERQSAVVADKIATALEQSESAWATGFLGDWSKAVAGTPAYDLLQTLTTIKANIGFDKLAEMRANSPTGGALGSVSDTENALLTAVEGALVQGQTKEQLQANLREVARLRELVVAERRAAFERDFGDAAPSGSSETPSGDTPVDDTPPPAPEVGATETDPEGGKWKFKGGDPSVQSNWERVK